MLYYGVHWSLTEIPQISHCYAEIHPNDWQKLSQESLERLKKLDTVGLVDLKPQDKEWLFKRMFSYSYFRIQVHKLLTWKIDYI